MPTQRLSVAVALALFFNAAGAALTARTDGAAAAAPTDPRITCAQLADLKLPDVKIAEAVAVPAASTGPIRAAHCRVNGVIGTEIRFSLLLPDTWNGKFFMVVSFGDVERRGHALWVAESDRPEGPFRLKGRVSQPSGR